MAFKCGDPEGYKKTKSRYDVSKSIKATKASYSQRLETYYTAHDSRKMWQGLAHITDYKGRIFANSSDSLPDELNLFYAHFETMNTKPWKTLEVTPGGMGIGLQVYKSLSKVNTR